MNKAQREPYLFIANFPREGWGLCNICKFAEFTGYSCCESELECKHPLDAINGQGWDEEHPNTVWAEGADCWGFRPSHTLQECGIMAGIRAEGYIAQWDEDHQEWLAAVPIVLVESDNNLNNERICKNCRMWNDSDYPCSHNKALEPDGTDSCMAWGYFNNNEPMFNKATGKTIHPPKHTTGSITS